MKNFILIAALLFWSAFSVANPIILPFLTINELWFTDDDEWGMEIAYYEVNETDFPIINIVISSTDGEAELLTFEFNGESGLILVESPSNLSGPCMISPDQDEVSLSWSVGDGGELMWQETTLIFGDHPDAIVTSPTAGQSIALLSTSGFFYTKDQSPTPGQWNDTTGTMGTLYGTIFDINMEPIREEIFKLVVLPIALNQSFTTSSEGAYSLRVPSNILYRNGIIHYISPQNPEYLTVDIHYIMEPDSIVNLDIYLLDSLTVGIFDRETNSAEGFYFYPNPLSNSLDLRYTIDFPIQQKEVLIAITSLSSSQVESYPVRQQQGLLKLSDQTMPGVYLVRLLVDNMVVSSNKLVISR